MKQLSFATAIASEDAMIIVVDAAVRRPILRRSAVGLLSLVADEVPRVGVPSVLAKYYFNILNLAILYFNFGCYSDIVLQYIGCFSENSPPN